MKTKLTILAALAVSFTMHASAWATHQAGHPASVAAQAHGGAAVATTGNGAADDSPMIWKAARYPGRVGMTLIRTPYILGQTFTGKRTFVSERGFFQANDDAASTPMGRGQRTPR
jgi:hypothetical protein